MAATQSTTRTKRYFSIVGGKFAEKATAETPNAVKRTNKKGAEVYELMYDKINGWIEDIQIRNSDFGEQLEFGLNDGNETCMVSIPVESKFFRHFAKKIDNVDLKQEAVLAPYSFIGKEGKKAIGLNIYQGGNKVAWIELPGAPKPISENLPEDEYKIFSLQETIFLKKYIKGKYERKSGEPNV